MSQWVQTISLATVRRSDTVLTTKKLTRSRWVLTQVCWNPKFSFLSNTHVLESLLPTLDYHAFSHCKIKSMPAIVTGIEHRAILLETSCVMHRKEIPVLRFSLAFFFWWLIFDLDRYFLFFSIAHVENDSKNHEHFQPTVHDQRDTQTVCHLCKRVPWIIDGRHSRPQVIPDSGVFQGGFSNANKLINTYLNRHEQKINGK